MKDCVVLGCCSSLLPFARMPVMIANVARSNKTTRNNKRSRPRYWLSFGRLVGKSFTNRRRFRVLISSFSRQQTNKQTHVARSQTPTTRIYIKSSHSICIFHNATAVVYSMIPTKTPSHKPHVRKTKMELSFHFV